MADITPGISPDTTTSSLPANFMDVLSLFAQPADTGTTPPPGLTGFPSFGAQAPATPAAAAAPATAPIATAPAAQAIPALLNSAAVAPTASAPPTPTTPAAASAPTTAATPPADHPVNKWAKWIALAAALAGGGAAGGSVAQTFKDANTQKNQDAQAAFQRTQGQQQQVQQQQQQQVENRQAFYEGLGKVDPATQEAQVKGMTDPQLAQLGLTRSQFYRPDGTFIPVTVAEKATDPASLARAQTSAFSIFSKLTKDDQQSIHDTTPKDEFESKYGVSWDEFTPVETQKDVDDTTSTDVKLSDAQRRALTGLTGMTEGAQTNIYSQYANNPDAFAQRYGVPYEGFKPGMKEVDALGLARVQQGAQRLTLEGESLKLRAQVDKWAQEDRQGKERDLQNWRSWTKTFQLDQAKDHRAEFAQRYSATGPGSAVNMMKFYDQLAQHRVQNAMDLAALNRRHFDPNTGNALPPDTDAIATVQGQDEQTAETMNAILQGNVMSVDSGTQPTDPTQGQGGLSVRPGAGPIPQVYPRNSPYAYSGTPALPGLPGSGSASTVQSSPEHVGAITGAKPYKPQLPGPWNVNGTMHLLTKGQVYAMPKSARQTYLAELQAYDLHQKTNGQQEMILKMSSAKQIMDSQKK